jgi:RNA polymerase sigma factor (TIGR02999 family)
VSSDDTTALLAAWSAGDADAGDRLAERLYPELRRLAARRLREAGRDLTLQPTELVHEAYLRLVDQTRTRWQSRAHFFAIASRTLRRVLANHARDRGRLKRGGGAHLVALDGELPLEIAQAPASPLTEVDVLALEEALAVLEQVDPESARLVELRFYGGLSVEETAEVLGVSRTAVIRGWRSARAWLKSWLDGTAAVAPPS